MITHYYAKVLLLLFVSLPLYAAAPVVHVYFAELYLDALKPGYTQKERDAFMRGTLFPDIRYIARIARTKTHRKNVTLNQVVNTPNPFTAGLLFHTYVDEQRQRIAEREKIYAHLSDIPPKQKGHFLKAIEDELCYTKINSEYIRKVLKQYNSEEGDFGVSIPTRMLWHRILRNYFKQSPLELFLKKAATKSGYLSFSPKTLAQIDTLMKKYSQDSVVKNYTTLLVSEFEKMLQKK